MIYLYSDSYRIEVLKKLLNEESLFLCIDKFMDDIDNEFDKKTTKVENWMDAKSFVETLLKASHPDRLVQIMANDLHKNSRSLSSEKRESNNVSFGVTCLTNLHAYQTDYETVVVLLYSMLIVHYLANIDENNKYQAVKEELNKQINKYHILNQKTVLMLTTYITEDVKNDRIEQDYDYVNNMSINNNNSIETIPASTVNELEQRIKQLEEQLAAYESGPIVVGPHDKVRLEIVTRLLEESSANFKKFGNKAEAARMEELITGLPFQTCKNFMTNRDLNTTEHSEEVLKANTSLMKLGVTWQL